MKITRLNIISFAALENITLSLSDRCVIYGRNGAGKSGIAEFIRIMFFGPDRNDRRRYLPWSGKPVEGELHFEHSGEEYAIYRIIGAAARDDRFSLTLVSTGEAVKMKPNELIGTDAKLLSDTLYIARSSATFSGCDDLSASLRSAAFGRGINAESAIKILEDNRRLISNPRGKNRGSLDEARLRLEEILSEKSEASAQKERLPALICSIEKAEEQLALARASYAKALSDSSSSGAMLKENELRLLNERSDIFKARRQSTAKEVEGREKAAKSYKNGAFLLSRLLFALAWILIGVGAILIPKLPILAAVLFVSASAAVSCHIYFHHSCRAMKAMGIHSDKAAANVISSLPQLYDELCRTDSELEGLTHEHSKVLAELCELDKKAIAAKADSEHALSRINALSEEVYRLRAEKELLEASSSDSLEARLREAQADIGELEGKLESINRAIAAINSSIARLNESWLPDLAEAVAENTELLTGERPRVLIDGGLNIKVYQNGPKDIELFSSGTRDQLFFALRLAAAKSLFRTDTPPLILDDPFIQYDEYRQKNAVDMLIKLSKKHQIIFFTCKNTAEFTNKGFRILTI